MRQVIQEQVLPTSTRMGTDDHQIIVADPRFIQDFVQHQPMANFRAGADVAAFPGSASPGLSSSPSGVCSVINSSAVARNCLPLTPGPALICDITCSTVMSSSPSSISANWAVNRLRSVGRPSREVEGCMGGGVLPPLSHNRIR